MAKAIAVILQKEVVRSKAICNLIGVMSFIVLTALGAYIRIPLPFTPVPITLQTFFVILAGAVLGIRGGVMSQVGYIILGAAGLPIFQNYSYGLTYLAGPTGGYLLGFIIAPVIIGKLISFRKDITYGWTVFAMTLGSMFILFLGTAHLVNFLRIGVREGIVLGVFYFLPGDFVKVMSAAYIYFTFNKRIRKIF